jgi:anti-sigma28 factor (negative regulator of flagellin synthesis)
MPIQDLGPSELGGRGLERARDAIELSRARRERAADDASDAAGSELERARAAGIAANGGDSAAEVAGAASGDRVELSLAARALSAGEDPKIAAQRADQIAAMKSAIASGKLVDRERVARAAEKLLGD